jgi:uncharacterized protein (TIGR02118 family)
MPAKSLTRWLALAPLLIGLGVSPAAAQTPSPQPQSQPSSMIKFASIWEQPGDPAALDRWYRTVHSREVQLFVGPWLRRYWAYRGYDAPPEANVVGAVRYRLTEMWYGSQAERQDAQRAWYPLSLPPVELADPTRTRIADIYVPAIPDETFVPGWPRARADYLRWVFFMRYPAGADQAQGDKWFAEDFAPAISKVPGVRRFVCHKSVDPPSGPKSWRRMCEVWFDDYAAWRGVLTAGPAIPRPSWGKAFPYFEITSIFTHQAPDMDFLRDGYRAP